MSSPSRHISQEYNIWGFFHKTFPYSLFLHKIAPISYGCQSLPISALNTFLTLIISPHALLRLSFMKDTFSWLMCTLWKKLNMGEVGDEYEETEGMSHGKTYWKHCSFGWYERTGDNSAMPPDHCIHHNPWWMGKWCRILLKRPYGWN